MQGSKVKYRETSGALYDSLPPNKTVDSALLLSKKKKNAFGVYERRVPEKGEKPDGNAIDEYVTAGALPVTEELVGTDKKYFVVLPVK